MAAKKFARYRQHFIVNGKHLGIANRDYTQVHEERREPPSRMFYCPVCGDVWAKFPVVDTLNEGVSTFLAHAVKCEKHGHEYLHFPGEIFLEWDAEFNDNFPDEAVRYEFNQMLKYYGESDE